MSLLGDLSGSVNSGGSANQNYATSWGATDAEGARAFSTDAATLAFERQKELMQMQMEYNSAEAALARQFNKEEAQKSRDWETNMANTIYTRSVKNMREAGINPILAANMGLSGANVGSGATASTSGATVSQGSAPLAQNFMDSASGSDAAGSGSSWSYGTSGLATGLRQMGALIDETLAALGSGATINSLLGMAGDNIKDWYNNLTDWINDKTSNKGGNSTVHFSNNWDWDLPFYRQHGGSHGRYTKE